MQLKCDCVELSNLAKRTVKAMASGETSALSVQRVGLKLSCSLAELVQKLVLVMLSTIHVPLRLCWYTKALLCEAWNLGVDCPLGV